VLRSALRATVLCVSVSAVARAQAPAAKPLYDRLGGKAAITAVVDDFVGRVAADTRINQKFAKSDIPRVKAMLVDQICEASGGPCKYTGRTMAEAHKGMAVTEGEFDALVSDLVATLGQLKVPDQEQKELMTVLAAMKRDIVEKRGGETGTPLPANYKNAPPLKR
jgi:hemoglobin